MPENARPHLLTRSIDRIEGGPLVSVAGHFGEWLQGRSGPQGAVVLVTLCCDVFKAHVVPDHHPSRHLHLFAAEQWSILAQRLAVRERPVSVLCDMPLGAGAGASTAALIAVARAWGFEGAPTQLADACLAIEGASDPLMFADADALVWASREARVVDTLPRPPKAQIVGGFWGEGSRTDPSDGEFPDISDLLPKWRAACDAGDLPSVAALASESADRTTCLRDMALVGAHTVGRAASDPIRDLCRDTGALGFVRAHTGSARGLIFAPGTATTRAMSALHEAGFAGVVQFGTGGPA